MTVCGKNIIRRRSKDLKYAKEEDDQIIKIYLIYEKNKNDFVGKKNKSVITNGFFSHFDIFRIKKL